ncbi:MAG: hypothetical protein V1770_00015, partial [bacterium]
MIFKKGRDFPHKKPICHSLLALIRQVFAIYYKLKLVGLRIFRHIRQQNSGVRLLNESDSHFNPKNITLFANKLRVTRKITDADINIIEKIFQKLYHLHCNNKKKIYSFYCVALVAAITGGLITSFIFPNIFKSNASTFSWTQNSWTGGISQDNASHSDDQSDWNMYAQKDDNLNAAMELSLSLAASSTSQTAYTEFSSGIFSNTLISGAALDSSISLDVNSAIDWSENCGKAIYDTPANASNVFIAGNYAYVADGTSGLLIINIGDVENPSLVGNYDTPSASKDVVISGDYAYVADSYSGLQVIDISNPQNPTFAGTYKTLGFANGVDVLGNYVYIANRTSGLQIIDISNPSSPSLASTFATSDARNVFILGNYAYVADYSSGLIVVNISDPLHPELAGSYNSPGYAYNVYVSGNYAYIADYSYGVQIIDISNPLNPSFAANYDSLDETYGIYIEGNYAYIADNEMGLQIINISNPLSPQFEGFYDTLGNAVGVYISGNYAFIADNMAGIQIVDIESPLIISE